MTGPGSLATRNAAPSPAPALHRDRGAAGFVFWIVLYAVFLVALMALGGGSRVLTVHHQLDAPAAGSARPA